MLHGRLLNASSFYYKYIITLSSRHLRVEIKVVQDDCVGPCEIQALPTRARRQQEDLRKKAGEKEKRETFQGRVLGTRFREGRGERTSSGHARPGRA